MDFLTRLEMLMRIKGVNKSELAAGAGLKKTTVYSWWDKGYEGITLPKLRAICNYFGCTLDWLICGEEDDSVCLSTDEKILVSAYRLADDRARADAVEMLRSHPREKDSSQSAM